MAAVGIISPKLNRTRPVLCACDLEDGDTGTNVIITLSTVANRRHRPSSSPRDSLLLSQPRRDRHVSWGYSSVNVTLALLLIRCQSCPCQRTVRTFPELLLSTYHFENSHQL